MTDKVTLSIIIPAYNVAPYIDAALESIRSQTEAPDEVIVIDDGSTDDTLARIDKFPLNCPHQIIAKPNEGQGPARNLGLARATSDYVYFFDSDDLLDARFVAGVKKQLAAANHPDILLFSGDLFGDVANDCARTLNYRRGFSGHYAHVNDLMAAAAIQGGLSCSPCLYVSRRSLWTTNRLYFGSNFYEDEALFYPLLSACESFQVVEDCWFYRRLRMGSTMTMTIDRRHVDGGRVCIQTLATTLRDGSINGAGRACLKDKLEVLSYRYITSAQELGQSTDWAAVFNALRASRRPIHGLKMLAYALKLHRAASFRRAVLALRRALRA